jgi:hypothetical protein
VSELAQNPVLYLQIVNGAEPDADVAEFAELVIDMNSSARLGLLGCTVACIL